MIALWLYLLMAVWVVATGVGFYVERQRRMNYVQREQRRQQLYEEAREQFWFSTLRESLGALLTDRLNQRNHLIQHRESTRDVDEDIEILKAELWRLYDEYHAQREQIERDSGFEITRWAQL
jgi:hypothetical protein